MDQVEEGEAEEDSEDESDEEEMDDETQERHMFDLARNQVFTSWHIFLSRTNP